MKRVTISVLFALGILAIWCSTVVGAVPQLINYQGRLTDTGGNPLTEIVALAFTIYDDSIGTTALWTESHATVQVTNGLFSVQLGKSTPIPALVFAGSMRWLGVRKDLDSEMRPLLPLVSVPSAYYSLRSDTANYVKQLPDNSVTSAKIQNGTIQFVDIGQNGAGNGQVMKWNGSAWAAANDSTSAGIQSGWTDNGTVVELTAPSDVVALNTPLRLGKLNVGGNVGISAQSSIYFGTDSTFIKGYTGGDMAFQSEDLFAKTTGSIYFGDVVEGNWLEFDNANKLVGVGTTLPDERLQVENEAASGRSFLQLETSNITNFGETGIRFKTPQNTWHLRMDDYTNNNLLRWSAWTCGVRPASKR